MPTIAESGLPCYQFDSWFGLLGPAATPAADVEPVHAAVSKLLKDPLELERLLTQVYECMAKVVKASGAKVE